MFVTISNKVFVQRLHTFIDQNDCLYRPKSYDEHPFTTFIKERLCKMDNHEFLRGFAQLVKEANIDNLCADFSRGHMFVTTIKPCARLAPERSEAAKKLADAFTPYWVQTIQKLRQEWGQVHGSVSWEDRLFLDNIEGLSSYSFWLSVVHEDCIINKTVTNDDFQLLVEADAEWIDEFGIQKWLNTPITGCLLVEQNPNGRTGQTYRRLKESLKYLDLELLNQNPAYASLAMKAEILVECLKAKDFILSNTDGRHFMDYWIGTVGTVQWKSFLTTIDLDALWEKVQSDESEAEGVVEPIQTSMFIEDYQPAISWFG